MVDFVLSNLANGGYLKMVVLTQYKSHSLDRHVTKTWRMSTLLGNYVTPVPAQQRLGPRWFAGSADAIFQSFNLIDDEQPDYIIVFGADHIYRMDPSQMVADHIASGAAVTVAGIRQPLVDGRPVRRDRGRPRTARQITRVPGEAEGRGRPAGRARTRSTRRWATTCSPPRRCTRRSTTDAVDLDSKHDMGGNIIPMLVERGEAQVYDFRDNDVPGSTDRDRGYWRDVGTLDSFYDGAHGPDRHPSDLQPLQPRVADLHRLPAVAAGQVRARLAASGSAARSSSMISPGVGDLRRAGGELGDLAERARALVGARVPAR